MVGMMRSDLIKRLSPEGRVRNSYESLYYRARSGDPETDRVVKDAIQQSFSDFGVHLTDNPSKDTLRDIMVRAYKASAKEIGGVPLSGGGEDNLSREFDRFTTRHRMFYEKTFDSFERKYRGETVDFIVDYNRMVEANGGINPFQPEPSVEELNAMGRESLKRFSRESELQKSGVAYEQHVHQAEKPQKRAYEQTKKEEAVAVEIKGFVYDTTYDSYKRSRNTSHQKTTVGDAYGFDEVEDDGPEL